MRHRVRSHVEIPAHPDYFPEIQTEIGYKAVGELKEVYTKKETAVSAQPRENETLAASNVHGAT